MSGQARSDLGVCPSCGVTIPESRLLIRYEAPGSATRLFAECPECETPVAPEEE